MTKTPKGLPLTSPDDPVDLVSQLNSLAEAIDPLLPGTAAPILPFDPAFPYLAWLPQGMGVEERQFYVEAYPNDPHAAAAHAWESWAVQMETDSGVQSIQTGEQSITYASPSSGPQDAWNRAKWHRARARAYSVEVAPTFTRGYLDSAEAVQELPAEIVSPRSRSTSELPEEI